MCQRIGGRVKALWFLISFSAEVKLVFLALLQNPSNVPLNFWLQIEA